MHELSLASGLIEQLLSLAKEHQTQKIIQATVIIGPFSGIVVDSFTFGFEALQREHDLTRQTRLIVETPDPEYCCRSCGKSFSTVEGEQGLTARAWPTTRCCPHCGGDHCFAQGGDELILKQLEME